MVGRDLLGSTFGYDPFELYRCGYLTNPNMVVIGQIGRGKSAFVKTYLWRLAGFGRRAWVVDPKGEYGASGASLGRGARGLASGGPVRLNPLDAGATSATAPTKSTARTWRDSAVSCWLRCRRQVSDVRFFPPSAAPSIWPSWIVAHLVEARTRRRQLRAHTADGRRRAPVPRRRWARSVGTDVAGLAADGRNVALELRRLVAGDLRGMFDGPTSPGLRLDAPLVVLDLSAVYHSAALGILMTCATAWLQAGLGAVTDVPGSPGPGHRIDGVVVVVDEAWAILANLGVARWLQSSWKLSRARGVANVAVLHRLSDLDTTGAVGSEQVGLARGLLADSETRVVYAQPPGEVERGCAPAGALVDRGRGGLASPPGGGAVEGGHPVIFGPAPTVAARVGHHRHRRPDGRQVVNGLS